MDRRGFLRSLIGAAIATQIPKLPAAVAKALSDDSDKIADEVVKRFEPLLINGKPPSWISVEAVSNGWYRIRAGYTGSLDATRRIDLDARLINEGRGLAVFESGSRWEREELERHPDTVFCNNAVIGLGEGEEYDMQFSAYVKPGETPFAAQLEQAAKRPTTYIETKPVVSSNGHVLMTPPHLERKPIVRAKGSFPPKGKWQNPNARITKLQV